MFFPHLKYCFISRCITHCRWSHGLFLLFLIFSKIFWESYPVKLLTLNLPRASTWTFDGLSMHISIFFTLILSNRGPLLGLRFSIQVGMSGNLMLVSHLLAPPRNVVFVRCMCAIRHGFICCHFECLKSQGVVVFCT